MNSKRPHNPSRGEKLATGGFAAVTIAAMTQVLYSIYGTFSPALPGGAWAYLPWSLLGMAVGVALMLAGLALSGAKPETIDKPSTESESSIPERTAA